MIYVDDYYTIFRQNGNPYPMLMCHMMTDGDEQELHDFAAKLGMKREWYQGDHYDIAKGKRALAVRLGAIETTPRKMVELRIAKRKVWDGEQR